MNGQTSQLGTEKVSTLLKKLSIPAFMGMFISGLFNIVDTIFIARGVGTLGVAGLSIAFPIQMVLAALVTAIGVGGALEISPLLGKRDIKEANRVLGHVIWLLLLLSLIVIIVTMFMLEPVLRLFGATKVVFPFAQDYLSIVLLGSIFISFAAATNNIVRAEGNANVAMLAMIISGLLNVVLNPIFLFGLEMGVQGTAIATVISQVFAALWLLIYFKNKSSLSLRWIGIWPKWKTIREIIQNGVPAFIQNASTSVLLVIVNWMLVLYGSEIHIAIYGIVNRLFMFLTMPVFGIVQGMQPIVGFNFGANRFHRVSQAIRLSMIVTTTIALIVWIFVMIFPAFFMKMFTSDSQVIESGIEWLRFIFLMTPLFGISMVASGLYQSLGHTRKAFVLSLSNLFFLTPFILIIPLWWGLYGILVSFPIAYLLSFLFSSFLLYKDRQLIVQRM